MRALLAFSRFYHSWVGNANPEAAEEQSYSKALHTGTEHATRKPNLLKRGHGQAV